MRILIGISVLCLGACTTTKPEVFWTQKDKTVTVHHVTGKVDHTEKLTTGKLPDDKVSEYKLADKGKYFGVKEQDDVFAPDTNKDSTPKKSDNSKEKLSQVTSELHDLKRQVSSLKEQLSVKKEPTIPVQPDIKDETVQDDSPRMSQ